MSAPPSDPVIDIAALRRLDGAALDTAVYTFGPRLQRFLRRLGASPEVAEELVQEAFVRLVRHAPRLQDDTRVGAWLYTVGRNLWRSHRRWAWVDGTRLLELAFRPGVPAIRPDEAAATGELGRRLEAAIAGLPEPQREVALLVIVEGLDPIEAATILGLSPEATRQRLARARTRLMEALA